MSDLNALLRWAVENSTNSQPSSEGGMQLKYKPAPAGSNESEHLATLHPSDSQFPHADLSPASTPGPATPADGEPPKPASELSTEMLDLIMGKSDSIVMKEKMAIATDESQDVETRVEALDDFEMLIELIDNANNMAILKLWQPLISLFKSPHQEIVRHALWIAGTAVQNNLKGQAALFVNDAFPLILDLIFPQSGPLPPTPTRAKAVYAFSSSVKHWPLASAALSANGEKGYAVLREGLGDSEPVIQRKIAFLLGTLVMQARDKFEGEMPNEVRNLLEERAKEAGGVEEDLLVGLEREGVFAAAVKALAQSDDIELEENAIRALARAAAAGALKEKAEVKAIWDKWGVEGQKERGLEGEDAKEISAALA